MKTHRLHRWRQAAQQLRSRFDCRALILMYHGVAEVGSDPWSLFVTPQHFAEHLEVLRQYARPMRLRRLTQAFGKVHLASHSVVVTFDDGYANNLHNARPLLERYDIPATVFLTTGYLGGACEFWWDELDRLLLQPGTLPETLELRIQGSPHQWELGAAAYYPAAACMEYRNWRAWEEAPTPRHALYASLWQLLQPLPEDERHSIVAELRAWAGAVPAARPTHRSLALQEVLALAQGNLVDVGSHTVTHPLFPALSLSMQRGEIQQSKTYLESVLGHPVTSFCYPYGAYTAETVNLVREAGFACACSTSTGTVGRCTDRWQLPRVCIEDWDGDELAKRLSMWFDG
jgi:peptidoglycan/xylan/chitin deacetylase (PgdA/CDA1 family)